MSKSAARREFAVRWAPVLVLTLALLAVFVPSLKTGLTYHDDQTLTIHNPLIRDLGPRGIAKMFSRFWITSYYPVRLLSFALDWYFWERDPTGYHLTNLVLHWLNVLLVYLVALRLLANAGHAWPALLAGWAALFFGVHPLVVEPVVWVAGREELLALGFSLASVLLLLAADASATTQNEDPSVWRRPSTRRALAALSYAFACLSNIVAVMLPLALLTLSVFGAGAGPGAARGRLRRAGLRLWPFALIATAAFLLKVLAPAARSALYRSMAALQVPLGRRLLTAASNYGWNVRSVLVPMRLSLCYPNELAGGITDLRVWLGLGLFAVTIWALLRLRRGGVCWFGAAWWLFFLAPSAQVVPHHVYRADRFLYFPLVGVAIAAADGLARLRGRARAGRAVLPVACAALLGLLAAGARQVGVWRDDLALFTRAVRLYPRSVVARQSLGESLARRGRFEESIPHYRAALRLDPRSPLTWNNLGTALRIQGDADEAVRCFREALALAPDAPMLLTNLGGTLAERGEQEQGAKYIARALALAPHDPAAHANMALLAYKRKDYAAALRHYDAALRGAPGRPDIHRGKAEALMAVGQTAQAARHFQMALAGNPEDLHVRRRFAAALAALGHASEALAHYQTLVRAEPQSVPDLVGLGSAYRATGNVSAALQNFSLALRLDPDSAEAHYETGLALAQSARFEEALPHWRTALRIRPAYAEAHDGLGRALIRLGSHDEGVTHLLEALGLAPRYARLYTRVTMTLAASPDPALRNGRAAVRLGEALARVTDGDLVPALDALAAAYAEAGAFDRARNTAMQAVRLAGGARDKEAAKRILTRVRLYQAGTPYRESAPNPDSPPQGPAPGREEDRP